MIQIYGSPRTSAGRCYLMLEEIGQTYETLPLDMFEKKEHKSADYLKLNPNGKVPCLKDGDFVIWESLAINSYLAEKYKPELLGANAQEKGLVQQWGVWGLGELQPPMVDIIIQMMFTPEPKRDMNVVKRAQDKLPGLLAILEKALDHKTYLVGDKFTLADLNVGSMVNITKTIKMPLDSYPNISAWMKRMSERPAFKKYMEMRGH